jgi:hypothetical protein
LLFGIDRIQYHFTILNCIVNVVNLVIYVPCRPSGTQSLIPRIQKA